MEQVTVSNEEICKIVAGVLKIPVGQVKLDSTLSGLNMTTAQRYEIIGRIWEKCEGVKVSGTAAFFAGTIGNLIAEVRAAVGTRNQMTKCSCAGQE
ncbi:MAG: acyl carrier protein [Candidatus Pacebacteria bacterium]|nr:acyl carrier protein [Candidatus Paceibacterota bacterium]